MDLSHSQKQYLRKLGTELKPSIWIGKEGVNDGIVRNTSAGLLANELVKIKVNQNKSDETDVAFTTLAEATGAAIVQIIGRTAVFYKAREDKPKITLP